MLFLTLTVVLPRISWADSGSVPDGSYSSLARTLRDHASQQVERVRPLVANGTLPKSQLDQAESRLADAEDELILSETLYGQPQVEKLTDTEAVDMVAAARRRFERQQKLADERQLLVDQGIISRAEFQQFRDELDARGRVLELAQNRAKLLRDLHAMAENERQLERAAQAGLPTLQNSMTRFEGNGHFTLDDLPTISGEFRKHFNHDLPVSALGQTLLHQSMQLDHRNRVDVALNPQTPEGMWLCQLLQQLRVPYIAFRNAVAGAATAPHIHIGLESTRLRIARAD
ncbi:MAG: hypothetical protein JO108_16870 [Acidobacteriaceae bacterium]|nr:hypothetical protein [Acidobacteriaceae bacterium]